MTNGKKHEVLSLGKLLMNGRTVQSDLIGEMPEMTAEEYRTFSDPAPGTDPSWDSLSDSEKAYFRNPPRNMGKTFSDLMKDREALEMDAKATIFLTTESRR